VPDPGTRPTPAPAPSPGKSPAPAPTKGGPGLFDKIADLLPGLPNLDLPSIPGADALGDATDAIRAVRAWTSDRHNWVRVAWFLSGGVLFVVGAVMVGERPLSSAVSTVTAPVGRVVKSVKG
jgi:hypothetical protein